MEQVENLPELDTEVQNLKSIISTISLELSKQFPGDQATYIQTIPRKDFMKEIKLRNQWIDTSMSISQTLIENYESLRILHNDLMLQNESKDIKIKEYKEEIQKLKSEEKKLGALETSRDSIGSGRRSLSNQRPIEGLLFSQLNKAGRMSDISKNKMEFILKAEKLSLNKKYEELQQKYLDQLNESQKLQRNVSKLEEQIKYNSLQKQIADSRYETLLSNHHQVKSQLEKLEKKGKDLKKTRKSMMPKLISKQVSWKSENESFDSKDISLLNISADAIKPEALKLGLSLDNSLSIIDSEIRGNSGNASNDDSRITTEESDIIENDLIRSKNITNNVIIDSKSMIRCEIDFQQNIQCSPIIKNYNSGIHNLDHIFILGQNERSKIRGEEEKIEYVLKSNKLSTTYAEEVANIFKLQLSKESILNRLAKLSLSTTDEIKIVALKKTKENFAFNKSEKIIEKPIEVVKIYALQKNKQKEYFDMTIYAVEQNLNYSESVYSNTPQILYDKLVKFNVPLCKWHKWVEKEIKAMKKRKSTNSGQFQSKVCSLFPFMGKGH